MDCDLVSSPWSQIVDLRSLLVDDRLSVGIGHHSHWCPYYPIRYSPIRYSNVAIHAMILNPLIPYLYPLTAPRIPRHRD